jgi:hypothetical protein
VESAPSPDHRVPLGRVRSGEKTQQLTYVTIETIKLIGGLVGLAGLFILFHRFFLGRPVVTIIPSKHTCDLRVQNESKHPIVLLSIRCWPRWVWIARDDTGDGMAAAAVNQPFGIILRRWESLNFPIVIQRGKLLNPKSWAWGPFVIWVHWRKTSLIWLPQVPKVIFSSAKALRVFVDQYRTPLNWRDYLLRPDR